ncbi:MAG TPA: hypothetical protein VFJ58_24445 [Armatimonadota bacterium]|nr:hypothetical protein [Armatimonadota bacterium]
MRYLLAVLCLSTAAVGAAPPPAAPATDEVVKVVSADFVFDAKGKVYTNPTDTSWYGAEGKRTESGGGVVVIPAGQPYEFELDARHKIATRYPDYGAETLPTGPDNRFVDYLGCHCAVVDTPSPAGATSKAWLATIAGKRVRLQLASWEKGWLIVLAPAILVEENAAPPRGGFGVPPGYKIVVGKLPWEQAPR